MCNIHARQLIASEICLKWLNKVRDQTEILNEMQFVVFYRANINRDLARTEQNQCVRKNQNQVDLNRNFPTQFNLYNSTIDSQIYGGKKPIDQTFTICLNQIIEKRTPDFFLDIHSGQTAFYYQQGINNDKQVEIEKKINETYPVIKLQKITTLTKDKQSINGHIFADLKVRKQVPFSFLFQTYGGGSSNQGKYADDDCFGMFNPKTSEELETQTDIWSDIMMNTISKSLQGLQKGIQK